MKEAPRSKLSADFPKRIIDQQAETCREMLKDWPLSHDHLKGFASKQVLEGRWERVWKRVGARLIPAYRRVK